jgi:hypothetical protein
LPKIETTGVSAARRVAMFLSSSTLIPGRRVEENATIFAFFSLTFLIALKNSISLGFDPGQPPSM